MVAGHKEDAMPDLIRLYIRSAIIGFLLAAVMVGLILWFNVGRIAYLVNHSESGLLAVFLLWLFNGIVFAGVQFGIAIMGMADDDDDEPPRGGGLRQMIPVPVRRTDQRAHHRGHRRF